MRSTGSRLVLTLLAVMLVLSALSGCAKKPQQSTGPVKLDASASGSSKRLKVGQTFTLSLESNASTGYIWRSATPTPTVIALVGEPQFTPQSNAIGAPSMETWTFRADRTGMGTLALEYVRPFETSAKPAATFNLNVIVK